MRIGRRSLTEALPPTAAGRDAALVRELVSGTLRLLPRLEALASILITRAPKPRDRVVESLILVGLYQLIAMRIPDHAAVSASVSATRVLQRARAGALVNAALRRFQREREALLAQVERDQGARWLMPPWLLQRLRRAYPADWQAIVEASNGRGPMFLRVNRLRCTTADYAARLSACGFMAQTLPGQPEALRLAEPVAAARLPGFADGLVSVQDAGAQWAAALLDPQAGERILDACAAPGGKTAHLLERAAGRLQLTALDVDPARLETVGAALRRLGLEARLVHADATRPTPEWAEPPYQRILLDAPCSATGVMRRHPDIKHLRRPSDIAALTATQAALLDALWGLLAPGGRLLYVTCSLLPEENAEQIAAFRGRHGDAQEDPLPPQLGRAQAHGHQLLPADDGPDGFFFALLSKPQTPPRAAEESR